MGRKAVTTRVPDGIQSDSGEPGETTAGEHETEGDASHGEEATTAEETPDVVGGVPETPDVARPEKIGSVGEGDEKVYLDADEDAETDAGGLPVAEGGATGTRMEQSLNTLINTIPGEVLVLWAALEGAAEMYGLPVWAYGLAFVFTVIATPVYVYRSIDRPDEGSDDSNVRWWQESNVRWQSLSATGALLVWVYYLGGPFQAAGLQNAALATVLVLTYPVLIVISPYYGSLLMYYLTGSETTDGSGSPTG